MPAAFVTTDFFHVVGTPVTIGRDFQPTDGEIQPPPATPADPTVAAPPPLPNVMILGYEYWKRRYGGDRKIVGSIIRTTGGESFLVVGIAPPGVEMLLPPQFGVERDPSLFVASRLDWSAPRNGVQLRVIGRLKPGATIAEARGEVQALNTTLDAQFPIHRRPGAVCASNRCTRISSPT